MKFLVPNYSCLQIRGATAPQIPVLSVLCPQLNLLNPPRKKNSWVRHWLAPSNDILNAAVDDDTRAFNTIYATFCVVCDELTITWREIARLLTEVHRNIILFSFVQALNIFFYEVNGIQLIRTRRTFVRFSWNSEWDTFNPYPTNVENRVSS